MKIELSGALLITFIVLKLTKTVDWDWIWVLAPLWIPVALVLGIFLVVALFVLIFGGGIVGLTSVIDKLKMRKHRNSAVRWK